MLLKIGIIQSLVFVDGSHIQQFDVNMHLLFFIINAIRRIIQIDVF